MRARPEPPLALIRYRRPGRPTRTFRQPVVHSGPAGIVTLLPAADRDRPLVIGGRVALENGSPIVWLTIPGASHDVGRFHTGAGDFTGFYTNVITPPDFTHPFAWSTTDLLLDVWQPVDGPARLLDEDELGEAVDRGLLAEPAARAARAEAGSILRAAREGTWPPPAIREWTLERALAAVGSGPRGRARRAGREGRQER